MQKLVYCVSTIQEIQRISAVASTSLPHGLTKDMRINGYHFPEGTSKKHIIEFYFRNRHKNNCDFIFSVFYYLLVGFIPNLKKFMYDPTVFPNPNELIPERFIGKSTDGSTIVFKVSLTKNTRIKINMSEIIIYLITCYITLYTNI